MIVAVMYGMTPSAKIDSCSSAPPENRLTSDSSPSVPPTRCEAGLHVGEVDEGGRDVRAEPVQGDDRQSECDLPTKVGCTEDPRDGAEQEDCLQKGCRCALGASRQRPG